MWKLPNKYKCNALQNFNDKFFFGFGANFYSINYGYGIIVENNQFLGTETTGAYRIDNPSVTNFFDISNNLLFNDNLEMYSNYSKFTTVTDMAYKNFVNISNIVLPKREPTAAPVSTSLK